MDDIKKLQVELLKYAQDDSLKASVLSLINDLAEKYHITLKRLKTPKITLLNCVILLIKNEKGLQQNLNNIFNNIIKK